MKKEITFGIQLENITEGHDYITDKSFTLSFDDDKPRQFGVYFETINMDEATGEPEFLDYPFVVSVSLVMDRCHKSFDESDGGKPSRLDLILDATSYMGGVPIDHILTHEIRNSNESSEPKSNFKVIANLFKSTEAVVKSNTHDFGTIAAQRGQGTKLSHLQFKTEAAAQKYIAYLIEHRIGALSMMIGFILDRPINMAGERGWGIMERMAKGAK